MDATDMDQEKQRQFKPKLRFPEFQGKGEWSLKFGNEEFEQITNKQHDSSLPVLAITQEYGAIPRDVINYQVSVTEKSLESYKIVEVGDFIISLRSFQGGIEYSRYKGICSPAYIILRKKTDDSEAYFRYFFKTERFIQQLQKNLEGLRDGKMVSYQQFSELLLPIPSINEQQKIADCLTSIDDLITAQTRKLDVLKDHKKGLLQRFFPAEGETLPKLRFPEFQSAGEWEVKSIATISKVTTGTKDTQNKVDDGAYPFFVRSQIVERINSFSFDGEAILTSGDGVGVGKNFHYIVGKFDFHQRVYCIYDFDRTVSGKFIYIYFSEHFYKRVMRLSAKNSVDSVRMSMITEMPILLPDLKEQQKIANCLFSLDELIAAQSQKLDLLQAHKQGLMQQLFPVLEEVQG